MSWVFDINLIWCGFDVLLYSFVIGKHGKNPWITALGSGLKPIFLPRVSMSGGTKSPKGYGKNQHEGPVREDGALVHWTSNATFWVFANWFGTNTQFLGAVNWTSNLYFIVLFKALDVSVFLDWHEFQGPSRPWRTTNTPSWKIPLAVCPLPCDSWHSAVTSCWPSCWWQTAWRSYRGRTFGRLETIEKLHVFMGEIIMDNSD